MKRFGRFALPLAALMALAVLVPSAPSPAAEESQRPRVMVPLTESAVGRYFVKLESPSVSDLVLRGAPAASELVAVTQVPAKTQVHALGGEVIFSYTRIFNGFSAAMTPEAASEIAERDDVERIEPVGVMERSNSSSVPFIGARKVWRRYGATGKGMKVAVIDTGIDYTHKAFGGKGTRSAFNRNDPTRIERGTFPTKKVIGGYDFVGKRYDVLDFSTSNDTPRPDPDPLDDHGHGTHVAGTCCGKGVRGKFGKGVAFRARILAYKVWGEGGSSSADVLVAAYERAVDPDRDGNFRDAPDVVSFSGGVPYGPPTALESEAAQRVVDLGVVFVAGAGNSGHGTTDGSAYVVGAPASAPGVIGVAASSDPDDAIAAFSSEGPARGSHALKPDITAPGVDIKSAAVGSGKQGAFNSGTSMATPHVSGVATLLLEIHPGWSPDQVKAAMMNHARPELFENKRMNVPATVKGAGRVRAPLAARATSFAIPSSLSFGLHETRVHSESAPQTFTLSNTDKRPHRYEIGVSTSYSAYQEAEIAAPEVSARGSAFSDADTVKVRPGGSVEVSVRLKLWAPQSEADRILRFYEILPGVDGGIEITQLGGGRDRLRVPWHVIPLAESANAASSDALVLGPEAEITFPSVDAAPGAADLYVLGATDPSGGEFGEEDIVAAGIRSFTGSALDGVAVGLPPEADELRGQTWLDALSKDESIEEPLEFAIATESPHETLRTLDVTVYIDRGADGVFTDPETQSDYILHKEAGYFNVCAFEADSGVGCEALYRPSFHQYDTNLIGMIADAEAMGLTDADSHFAYRIAVCTDRFSGDVPQPECDHIGFGDGDDYTAEFDPLDPPLKFSRNYCGNFWSSISCSEPITVSAGGSYAGESILAAYPNNSRGAQYEIIETSLAPSPTASGSGSPTETPSSADSGSPTGSPSP